MSARVSRAAIFEFLNTWEVPGTTSTLVSLKAVKAIDVDGARVRLEIQLPDAYKDRDFAIRQALEQEIVGMAGVEAFDLNLLWEKTPEAQFRNLLGGTVKKAIVVGSGKGGVGKSTVASNLACAAVKLGLKVGLLDADLYGPSLAMMFGTTESPMATADGRIAPVERYGLKLMGMGFIIEDDKPIIWRGPMLNKALQQFLGDVVWGDLDLLVIDLPPGTGDIQISLIQNAQVDGAIVVSTPQDVAFLDAKKAIGLFNTAQVPVIGVIENMSSFLCPNCQHETHIFGNGGVKAAAERMGLPFLGEVPIDLAIREGGDSGTPIVLGHPESPETRVFMDMARRLATQLGL